MQDSEVHLIYHRKFSEKDQIYSICTSPPKTQQTLIVGYLFMLTTMSAALTVWLPGRPTRSPCSSGPTGIPNKEGQYLNCVFQKLSRLSNWGCCSAGMWHRVIGAWWCGTTTMSQSQNIWHQLPYTYDKAPHPWRTYIKSYFLDLKIYNVVIYKHMHSTHGKSVEYSQAYCMHHSHVGTDELFTTSNTQI